MADLEKEQRSLELQLKVQEQKERVRELKGKLSKAQSKDCTSSVSTIAPPPPSPGTQLGAVSETGTYPGPPAATGGSSISLAELRQMEELSRRVNGQVQLLTGDFPGTTSHSDSGDSLRGSLTSVLKSGFNMKATDVVKIQLKWPQTALKYGYGSGTSNTYNDLDLNLLSAGELAICLSADIGEKEKKGRLELLETIQYHAKHYDWHKVRDFHRTVLLEIEKGEREWGGRFSFLTAEASTLYVKSRGPGTNSNMNVLNPGRKPGNSANGRRFFCKTFQRGNCRQTGSHTDIVSGRSVLVEHFCATCYQREGVVAFHSEVEGKCPRGDSK